MLKPFPCVSIWCRKGIQNLESWKSILVESDGLWKPESKLHWQRIGNSVPGIQNPWGGIQNPRHKTTVLDSLTWGNLYDCVLLS